MSEEAVELDELGMDEELGGLDVLVIGQPRPADPAATARQIVQLAVDEARSETEGAVHRGLSGFEHWAGEIEKERVGRGFGMRLVAGILMERRAQAAPYLRRIAPFFDGEVAARLEEAGRCYDEEMEPLSQIGTMFPLMGGRGQAADLDDPEVRRKTVALIHQAREWEEKAVQHLEEALALMQ
jgi:hypothetical protein